MTDLILILLWLLPLWLLLGYLFARGNIKSRTKLNIFMMLLYSFVIYPIIYYWAYYLYDSFYLWQDYHCQSSFGLGVADGFCITPETLDWSRLSDNTFFVVQLLLACVSQLLLLGYIDIPTTLTCKSSAL